MIYHISLSGSARRRPRKLGRSGSFNPEVLNIVLHYLEKGAPLPERAKDHQLHGKFSEFRECHLGFDLLLLYKKDNRAAVVTISDIGTHQELFGQ